MNVEVLDILDRCADGRVTFQDLLTLIRLEDENNIQKLFNAAYQVKIKEVGPTVRLRGIIEFSNICTKNCLYCGIRKSNSSLKRFSMTKEEVVACAKQAFDMKYGSVVMQSGERSDPEFIDFVEECLREIKNMSAGKLGITLSLGEQSRKTYRRWFEAGAHRYLLRIESSSENIYKTLHPEDHSFKERKKCLSFLRDEGYQVGTGVLVGVPGQSYQDLVNDIMFFKEQDIDMIGLGPYIMHPATPMASLITNQQIEGQLLKALKMIACLRLVMPDINIAATTALQALDPQGREKGLKAGANVIMPNLTDTKYRESYKLYDGKPCLDENAEQCRGCLEKRIAGIGENISYNEWGDSPHFKKRNEIRDEYNA